MRRFLLLILCLILFFSATALSEESEKPLLLYFFENYCESCHPEQEFQEEFPHLTTRSLSEYEYKYFNIKNANNRAFFHQVMDEYGIPEGERIAPAAVVDGVVYCGESRIKGEMVREFVESAPTDSVLYVLTTPACESCTKVKDLLSSLEPAIQVTQGTYSYESKLVIHEIDILENLPQAQMLFETYGVPEAKQIAPCVFLRDSYYSGADSALRMLRFALERGDAVGTKVLTGSEAVEAPAGTFSLWRSGAAGFVAGFNPCALSMLLFFLSILLAKGEHAGKYAALFLISKFITYIAIGTALKSVFSAWNPTWLPYVAKGLLTIVGAILIILNVMDAISAQRAQYGAIHNQLPKGMRGFLHGRIKGALLGGKKFLAPSVLILGAIVAAGEFLCSGQLYLASLISGAMYIDLIVFSAAFTLPGAVLAFLVLKAKSDVKVTDALLAKMPLIKLATAVAMLLIILSAWFL